METVESYGFWEAVFIALDANGYRCTADSLADSMIWAIAPISRTVDERYEEKDWSGLSLAVELYIRKLPDCYKN